MAIIRTWRVRANHLDFITKELSNAIIPRSKLCNLYFKVRSDENRARYKKQMNFVSYYLKKLNESTMKISVYGMLLILRSFGKE